MAGDAPREPDCPRWAERKSASGASPCRREQREYRELPGLLLTEAPAARLRGLQSDVCRDVLATLVGGIGTAVCATRRVSTVSLKDEMDVMQQNVRRPTWPFSGRRTGIRVLAVLVTLAASGATIAATQPVAPPSLSGSWTLQESTGDLPDQVVRAFDGSAVSTATIDIEEASGSVTVRRITPHAVVLRVMLLHAGERNAAAIQGAVLTARAHWQDRTLAARGDVTIVKGFLKRRVPYQEEWQVGDGERTLTVTLSVQTPVGVKRRTQVFVRRDVQKNLATK